MNPKGRLEVIAVRGNVYQLAPKPKSVKMRKFRDKLQIGACHLRAGGSLLGREIKFCNFIVFQE